MQSLGGVNADMEQVFHKPEERTRGQKDGDVLSAKGCAQNAPITCRPLSDQTRADKLQEITQREMQNRGSSNGGMKKKRMNLGSTPGGRRTVTYFLQRG